MTDQWHNCYDAGWGADIVPAAFAHPAKASKSLIFRIVEHCTANGWLKPGDTVLDPFGGIGTTALPCLLKGVNVVTCELEAKFVEMQQQNAALWQRRYGAWPAFKTAQWTRLCGDSRQLSQLIAQAEVCVSSPPYADSINSEKSGIDWSKADPKWGSQVSPVRLKSRLAHHNQRNYGHTNGQLGSMREGDIDLALSSPPYAEGLGHGGGNGDKDDKVLCAMRDGYGQSAGQLGAMPDQGFDAAVSSPPYEAATDRCVAHGGKLSDGESGFRNHYSENPANLGNPCGAGGLDTFWLAARQIVQQVFLLLRPGGHAVWITKNYVKARKEVDFNGNWQRLCESIGFQTVCTHQAMLVETRDTNLLLNGGEHTIIRQHKSFFRRLAESKGSPPINFECVTCMRKPQ